MLRSGKKEALEKYKCYCNTLKRLIRHSKSEYFLAKCTAFKNNCKKLWSLINRTISKSHNKLDSIDIIKVENIYKADAQSITSAFCNHFSKVGKSYAEKISKSNRKIEDFIRNIEINNHSLFLTPISESKLRSLINALPNKNSSGHDNINNVLLKPHDHMCKQISV